MANTMVDTTAHPAAASGTFSIGGDMPVVRLGYGAMRLTGPGIWGPPRVYSLPMSNSKN
jgi:pyridoxine 4-dehydrogenase